MTQPQQPFGEVSARACTAVADPCAYCGRPIGDIGATQIAGQRFHWQCTMPPAELVSRRFPSPLRETCETLDAAELAKRNAAEIVALKATVAELRARLDDHFQRQAL